jgi:hypothetical protein
MHVFWRIRYLDRTDRHFKDRDLFLDTDKLAPELAAAVELALETKTSKSERAFLRFRPLFTEDNADGAIEKWGVAGKGSCFCLTDYIEDEAGSEMSGDEMCRIVTGSPTARLMPSGAEQHDIDFMLSQYQPMPIAEITLSANQIKLLGYFRRDLRELSASAFMKEGPGTLKSNNGKLSSPTTEPFLETAASDEEIRSFITIFRRLYMDKEPANFLKAASLFGTALGANPFGKWVVGAAASYETTLNRVVDRRPFGLAQCNFTRKRLIDVFLYTRYAHQPDERKQRQYGECLAEIGGSKVMLTWLFLTEIWKSALHIQCAGNTIVGWFERHCHHHGLIPDVLPSVLDDAPGIGQQEKEFARKQRLFHEKADELAKRLWTDRGSPSGGHLQFLDEARTLLSKTIQGDH